MDYEPIRIKAAVASICPDIQERVHKSPCCADERELWWELSACLLSSQVPWQLAAAAADALDRSQLLVERPTQSTLERHLYQILSGPLKLPSGWRSYRFPAMRAEQLARTHSRICGQAGSLSALIDGFAVAADARQWLVSEAPGIGPKQASMFLRNIGKSYDLAILDRHVLEYMVLTGLRTLRDGAVNSLARYGSAERVLRGHAADTRCAVGIMDWAIWIVMRVAKRDGAMI